MKKKSLIKISRWVFSILVILTFFYLSENNAYEAIDPQKAPILYSNVCHDNLEKIFVDAVQEAQSSIFLVIYSLSDEKLIRALNRQAAKGLEVKVMHDKSTPSMGFQKLSGTVEHEKIAHSGLMHQKILVIDAKKIWLGSANMTTESLKLHDNLVIGLESEELAKAIKERVPFAKINCGGQWVEYWDLPKKGKEGLERLLQLIESAQKTIRIAMFTWTHHALSEAIIRAHRRGVVIEILFDRTQGQGVCHQTVETLLAAGIPLHLSQGLGLLHHKFAWIDETILINGSANWTHAAFTRNRDCFLILHDLHEEQQQKLKLLWQKTAPKLLKLSLSGSNPNEFTEAQVKNDIDFLKELKELGRQGIFANWWYAAKAREC